MKSYEYINMGFEKSGLKVKEAAELLGFRSSCQFSSVRSGAEKLPKNKIFPICDLFQLDPVILIDLLKNESPDGEFRTLFEHAQNYMKQPMLTKNDLKMVLFARHHSDGCDINFIDNTESPDWKQSENLKQSIKNICATAKKNRDQALQEVRSKKLPGPIPYKKK